MARNTTIQIDIETSQSESSLKAIRNELKKVKDEMAGMEEGSKEFLLAAKRAGELNHKIQEINASVRGCSGDFGDLLGNVTKVGAGMTGAFQAAKGAMTLFGVESKNVEKAIQDMQAVMAMTQGLAAIDQAIKSFKKLSTVIGAGSKSLGGFKKALIGTGLGALVVILGSIIANWDEFTQAIGLSEKQLNKLGEVAGGVFNVLTGSLKAFTKAITKAITGDFKGAWETLKGELNIKQLYNEGVEATITKREKEEQEKRAAERQKQLEQEKKERDEYLKAREAEYDRLASKARATISDEKKLTQELINIESQRLKLYAKGTKEYYDQLIKINDLRNNLNGKKSEKKDDTEAKELEALEKELDRLRKSQRTKLQVIEESKKAEEDIIAKSREKGLIDEETYQQMLLEIDRKYQEEKSKYALSELGKVQGGSVDESENFEMQLEALEAQKQAELDITKQYYEEGLLAKEDYEARTLEIERVYAEQSAQVQGQRMEAIGNVAVGVSNLITGVLSDIADQQDTSTKEGFEKQKKLQIAQATIQMITGIATALSGAFTTKSGPWDIALMAIQAATIAASGIAQITKIKNTQFDSASSGSANTSVSRGAASNFVAPVQYTKDVQGGNIEDALGNVKVNVLESDITDTQDRVNVAESESRY